MVKALVSLLLVAVVSAADWSVVLEKVESQVVRLEMQMADGSSGSCSGVVINAEAGFILTAAHCVDAQNLDITVAKRHAVTAKTNRILDLAVVRTSPHVSLRTLKLAKDDPKMGHEIAVVGFPFGVEKLHTQFGHIARQPTETELWVNADIIPGDSGGALINQAGELVGINVAILYNGPAHMGLAVPLEVIREFILEYLPKEVQ